MEREWLAAELTAGRSIESLAREVGLDGSTVAYWMRRHGLASTHAERHARRGGLSRDQLQQLVAAGLSTREIAREVGRSLGTVRHWLREYGLVTARAARRSASRSQPGEAVVERDCPRHGLIRPCAPFGRGGDRCLRCRSQAVADHRRRVKARLVAEAGGACTICGYSRSVAALQFHHLDPDTKRFSISVRGVTRALERAREEAGKSVLLCANWPCGGRIRAAARSLDSPGPQRSAFARSGVAQLADASGC
jgi:transposase-like protein